MNLKVGDIVKYKGEFYSVMWLHPFKDSMYLTGGGHEAIINGQNTRWGFSISMEQFIRDGKLYENQ